MSKEIKNPEIVFVLWHPCWLNQPQNDGSKTGVVFFVEKKKSYALGRQQPYQQPHAGPRRSTTDKRVSFSWYILGLGTRMLWRPQHARAG